jgi:hypothetical protein
MRGSAEFGNILPNWRQTCSGGSLAAFNLNAGYLQLLYSPNKAKTTGVITLPTYKVVFWALQVDGNVYHRIPAVVDPVVLLNIDRIKNIAHFFECAVFLLQPSHLYGQRAKVRAA